MSDHFGPACLDEALGTDNFVGLFSCLGSRAEKVEAMYAAPGVMRLLLGQDEKFFKSPGEQCIV